MAKNQAEKEFVDVDPEFAVPNFDTFVDEQTGFPPYWTPEKGKMFYALPVARDERDPDFMRYLFKALVPMKCNAGDSANKKVVDVLPGQFFTCSTYGALRIELYILAKLPVQVIAVDKRPIAKGNDGQPRQLWDFRVRISPENKKILDAKRVELLRELAASGQANPAQELAAGA